MFTIYTKLRQIIKSCVDFLSIGESISDSRHYGWKVEENVSHDWEMMVQAIQDHVHSLNWGYKVQLRNKKVKYYNKYASLVDNHTLTLKDKSGNEETVTARNIVLAMGGRPTYPDIPGAKECAITRYDLMLSPSDFYGYLLKELMTSFIPSFLKLGPTIDYLRSCLKLILERNKCHICDL